MSIMGAWKDIIGYYRGCHKCVSGVSCRMKRDALSVVLLSDASFTTVSMAQQEEKLLTSWDLQCGCVQNITEGTILLTKIEKLTSD